MATNQLKIQHLLWRSGFGPAASQLHQLAQLQPLPAYQIIQRAAHQSPIPIDTADPYLKALMADYEMSGVQKSEMAKSDRKLVQQKQRDSIKNLNLAWLHTMVTSEASLREKMSLFWHGHFACRNNNVFFQQQLLTVIRQHALGNFKELLHQVSKSAAMLQFLNNNQNRKGHPNENFAREVMELFTLGRGHYTEKDVKEAARAFTGWGTTIQGEFVFRKLLHDDGSKTVLGQTGNFDGDAVLDLLLAQEQTAIFITRKIYAYFVNDTVDEEKVLMLAHQFYQSDYNIAALMEAIFTADWFYDDNNIGVKIKSPIELLVGLQRMLPMRIVNEQAMLLVQRVLGQVLFFPPNVAGWPGGPSWIDSSTLMVRMRLPQLITDVDEWNITPKTDDDQMGGRNEMPINTKPMLNNKTVAGKAIEAHMDWQQYTSLFNTTPRDILLSSISSTLLQTRTAIKASVLNHYIDASSRESYIKTVTIQLMSTPEYQLC